MNPLEAAESVAEQFEVSNSDIQNCVNQFITELNDGLSEWRPTMCQIPTYITRVANGTERGFTLAVDLGGTNLKICSVDLHGNSTYTTKQSECLIPKNLTVASKANDLFAFIAAEIKAFLEDHHANRLHSNQKLSLGFCFAFPLRQTSVNSGVLLHWVKGFDVPDAVNRDVCQLLQNELDNQKVPVKISAIVNDTLGTLMTRAYTLPVNKTRTSVGAIFSTGTNGAYLEQLHKIKKDIGKHDSSTGEMFLSTEWGSFDQVLSVLSNTQYDQHIAQYGVDRNMQMFEKRMSGPFLGELLRIAIERMYDDPRLGLFPNYKRGDKKLNLRTPWSVEPSMLSIAEGSDTKALTKKIEEVFGFPSWAITLQDSRAVQMVSRAIGRRAARLAGMAVGAVIIQSGKLQHHDPLVQPARESIEGRRMSEISAEARMVDVAVDGNVFEMFPRFEVHMRDALRAIDGIGPEGERRIRIGLAKDGSSVGTAIIALLAAQQEDVRDGLGK
ncbi:glucokinase [Lithohypha guttulata]|uniref:Phosphotransferase n=1 Tax=Lithohypha guttulata TaxID=1690604 RepID=A0AAN7SUA8_9EURO|nr:glucokinase [Lithohypha guttulata]